MTQPQTSKTPVDRKVVDNLIEKFGITNFGKATIREIKAIAAQAEQDTGIEFIKMEMGVPGLSASSMGVKAEIEALQSGVASVYADIDGIPALKEETSRFVKAFVDVDIPAEGCVPVTGSMQGTYAAFLTASQCDPNKDTILFIDPGFPVQKQQLVVMGQKYESFDIYEFRGEKLQEKLESYLKKGNISALIYSNPNNPSWISLKDEELKIIGELCQLYDVILLEDLAYFAMDFRRDLSKPFEAPFQLTAAKYCDNYVLLISASKAFSYAGQRIGVACISDKLYHRKYKGITQRYGMGTYGSTFVHRVLYALSAGVSHSAQYALAAMFKAANDGKYNFLSEVREYGNRAQKLKEIFLRHGFKLVYDNDMGEPIADGFYFTITYPGMSGGDLSRELMYYGVSAISLETTGSSQQGLRICTSFIYPHQYEQLDERLKVFGLNQEKK
ncbi:pyridoxal phosphate-dependent aminotransferase [Dysgonomonas sp. 520]|uniref:aminotransferase class I/II-fold pyridoxal phosphate-dependent enzyme n=1 Tax=Dysgonomonas sp. 520 TaxID=2302931 RepID=UPI0013D7C057|nr:pyridoxal phosphate-dependent aminotransferase [Dysgonomonas sp. 520]NDW09254.1 pyridoxal phosphate-dependent aminotransferase [Dysgonomonas sp. 520]